MEVDYTPMIVALKDITFSETEVAKIYKVGKKKVQSMVGTDLRCQQSVKSGRMGINAWDVLRPLFEQCVHNINNKNK